MMKKKDKILQNAIKIFLKKGYKLTSTHEIAQASGTNKALIHYYFGTKKYLYKRAVMTVYLKEIHPLLKHLDENFPVKNKIRLIKNFSNIIMNKYPMIPSI